MTTEQHDHPDTCLMCAVRALTEGAPAATWAPREPGQTISGVVLRQGEVETDFDMGPVPFVDLWQGGTGRVRVVAYAATLRLALSQAGAQVGDRLQLRYDRDRTVEKGVMAGRTVKVFIAEVQRGH
jgi:hypothetical protein